MSICVAPETASNGCVPSNSEISLQSWPCCIPAPVLQDSALLQAVNRKVRADEQCSAKSLQSAIAIELKQLLTTTFFFHARDGDALPSFCVPAANVFFGIGHIFLPDGEWYTRHSLSFQV